MSGKKGRIADGGFHHIALRVSDFDRSMDFYENALGLEKRLEWGQGDKRAALLDMGDGGCIEIFAGGEKNAPEGLFWHLAFKTSDPDGAYGAAIAAGAVSHREPGDVVLRGQSGEIPARIAFVRGFDGELLEFFHEK